MSQEERAFLRAKAEAELLESGEYKEQFINEPLIAAMENEILKRENPTQ
jgi:hypothetical protein